LRLIDEKSIYLKNGKLLWWINFWMLVKSFKLAELFYVIINFFGVFWGAFPWEIEPPKSKPISNDSTRFLDYPTVYWFY
jgi:hypothetical protein